MHRHLIHGFLGQHESVLHKRHLNRLSRFCTVTGVSNTQTDTHTQTTERRTCVAIGRAYVIDAMWPKLLITGTRNDPRREDHCGRPPVSRTTHQTRLSLTHSLCCLCSLTVRRAGVPAPLAVATCFTHLLHAETVSPTPVPTRAANRRTYTANRASLCADRE